MRRSGRGGTGGEGSTPTLGRTGKFGGGDLFNWIDTSQLKRLIFHVSYSHFVLINQEKVCLN